MARLLKTVVTFFMCVSFLVNVDCIRITHRQSRHKKETAVLRSKIERVPDNHGNMASSDTGNDIHHSIYSSWSEWSTCSRKCKQERSRQCNAPWRCGNVVTKEERSCTGRRCKKQPFTVVDGSEEMSQKGLSFGDMKSVLYSKWSKWSPCTRNCRTRRYRTCQMEEFCGSSVIQEDAFCYVRGTVCERTFRKLKKEPHLLSDILSWMKRTKYDIWSWMKRTKYDTSEQQLPKEPFSKSPVVEECGMTNVSSDMALRIIGGQAVNRGKWPWQVAILNRFKEAFCGGTLVAPQWVMTAAHCARKRLYVRLGEHALSTQDGSEQEYRVVHVYMHPDYDPETVDNDIALLKLSSPASLDKHVQLACLPKQNAPLILDKPCTILGWGKEKHMAAAGTDVLREAKVPVVDIKKCLEVYEDYYITENMFCAGDRRGRVDSCAGDSGGPLLCESNNRWHVYGITSFGEGCGRKGKYGIYVKVPNYITWMETTMEDNSDVL